MRSGRTSRAGKLLALALSITLIGAGSAVAVVLGMQNQGFEGGLGGWTITSKRNAGNGTAGDSQGKPNREMVYGPGGAKGAVLPCPTNAIPTVYADRYGACAVGPTDSIVTGAGTVDVNAPQGDGMVRLGGKYNNPFQRMNQGHKIAIEQTFTVRASEPVLHLRNKLLSFERLSKLAPHGGRDLFRYRFFVDGAPVRTVNQNMKFDFGGPQNRLRRTGWRDLKFDLRSIVGDELTVVASLTGRGRDDAGSWAYLEAETDEGPFGQPDPGTPDSPSDPGITVLPNADLPKLPEPAPRDSLAPEVEILNKKPRRGANVRVQFRASADAYVRCKLDRRFLRTCESPMKLKGLGPWKHTFTVDATDSARNRATDSYTFKVRRHRGDRGRG